MTRNMTALKTNKPAIISVGITISNNVSVSAIFRTAKIIIQSNPVQTPLKTRTKRKISTLNVVRLRSAFFIATITSKHRPISLENIRN